MMDKSVPWVMGVVVLLTIGAGLWTLRGPATAEQEKRDKARMSDVQNLNAHVICLTREAAGQLPVTLPRSEDTPPRCTPVPRMTDPFTDTQHGYERLSEDSYRICAAFEKPELIAYPASFDASTGCVGFSYQP
jgi:hypothetical protein